jgi:F0F1-type ATP synthase membrane subunit b/b'
VADQVERFYFYMWVSYSDYEKLQADLDSLRSQLREEVERLREEAAACRDEAARRPHKVIADLALAAGTEIDRRADRLSKLLSEEGQG